MSRDRNIRVGALCVAGALAFAGFGVRHADARDLGRLFFTPEQRSSLERMRYAPPPKEAPKPVAVAEPAVAPPPLPPVALNGVVTRSGGRSTTWVNGVEQHDTLRPTVAGASVPVGGPSNRRVPLKVGETFEPETSMRYDVLRGGSIRVRPAE